MRTEDSVSTFHQSRISFAIIDHKLVHTMFDKRTHKEWLSESYGISDDDYEDIIRGYMKDGNVYFYVSSDFKPVNLRQIGMDSLNHIHILSMVYMNTPNPKCFNGMHKGTCGSVWVPIKELGSLQDMIDQRFRSYGVVNRA